MSLRAEYKDYYRDKKVLVAGGAGFIGSNISEELVRRGVKVGVIDGFVEHTGANRENIKSILNEIELYDSRIEGIASLREIVENFEFIIDCMAMTSHHFSAKRPLFDTEVNLLSHIHLIEALKGTKDKKVIYLGSRGQYGRHASVITEETPQNPLDPQGINKAAAESFFRIYSKKYNFRFLGLRITNCFGERQKKTGDDIGVVGSFIRDLLQGATVEIYGDAARKKNIVYVKDLVGIILDLMRPDFERDEAYNIAGITITLKNLLDRLIGIIGKGGYKIMPFPEEVRHIDVGEAVFSGEKIKRRLKDMHSINLEMSLTNTVNYFRVN